jgi:cysteinyl-tRNA synthetase
VTRSIVVTNTLSGRKEPLRPLTGSKIGMYACGVTVYDDCHIGHAMQAIFFDVIRNYLKYAGYSVTYVRNFTDVDDKIINRARERGISPVQLAEDMIASSERDMAAIGVAHADHEPRVSQMIPQIIAMVQTLVDNGAAYVTTGGDVYYRVRAKGDYGKLSGRKVDELRGGTRDIVQGDKEDTLDFALWKKDDVPGASWPSPWGTGRPGWHIECSAMARELLGHSFEIHGGGRDLVFPHHENEIAQSESANKAPYASVWMHCGLLTIEHQKMSKSLGNHITIQKFLQSFPAEVLRLGILQHHYTSNIDFSRSVFLTCHRRLLYFHETMAALDSFAREHAAPAARHPIVEEFHKAMQDDFNTAGALGAVSRVMRTARELVTGKKSPDRLSLAAQLVRDLREVCGVLGLLQGDPAAAVTDLKTRLLPELGITESEIAAAIAARKAARASKDFAAADRVRDELAGRGIELRDGAEGTTWSIRVNLDEQGEQPHNQTGKP